MGDEERESQDKGKRFSLQDLGIRIERAKVQLGPLLITIEDTEAGVSKEENLKAERDKLLERLREIDRKLKGEKPEP
jgi:hypothetical protein